MKRLEFVKIDFLRQTLLITALVVGATPIADSAVPCDPCALELEYEAKIGFFKVGAMNVEIEDHPDGSYVLSGEISVGGPAERFLSWRGQFESKGEFHALNPVSRSYTLVEDEWRKGETETVIVEGDLTRIYETGKSVVEIPKPDGIDIMSALLLTPGCTNEMLVHDGEDTYEVQLYKHDPHKELRQGRNFFAGTTRLCRYKFVYDVDHVRKVDIWIAAIDARLVPVRIRMRVPFLPDGILKLRLPS